MTLLASAASHSAPGALGFLVVFGMAVVLFFLFRSMSKHLRKVRTAARQEEEAGRLRADQPDGDGSRRP